MARVRVPKSRRNEQLDGLTDQLVSGVTEQPFRLPIDEHD
jgi:hypothetical protein